MTLRITTNANGNRWTVEYLNTWTGAWYTCAGYYPKAGREIYASFKSEEEAKEFMAWKYDRVAKDDAVFFAPKSYEVPADYYRDSNRYYGD